MMTNMRELSQSEMRSVQIGILDYVDRICRENSIRYWLDYGTLLGAIRHKGYIPWDDDVDISMLRDDYDRFIEACKKCNNKRYILSAVEIDPECMYPFGKMIDTKTFLNEGGNKGINTGVYVDIFVYDDSPIGEDSRNQIYDKLDFYGRLRRYQLPLGYAPISIKRIGVLLARFIIKILFPRTYFTRKIVQNAREHKVAETGYVGDFTCPYYNSRWICEKNIFTDQIELEFEGKYYKAPRNYDKWLKLQYGEYMRIPSRKEQLASQHDVKAYWLD